jgi:hypothetical protein
VGGALLGTGPTTAHGQIIGNDDVSPKLIMPAMTKMATGQRPPPRG